MSTELEPSPPLTLRAAFTKAELDAEFTRLREVIAGTLHEVGNLQGDYGTFYGAKRQSLLLPGAEKLARQYALVPMVEILTEHEDWPAGFVAYKVRCRLLRFGTGEIVGEALGSANSESRTFQGDDTKPGWKKPSIYELSDKVLARAAKRAYVAAVGRALCVQSCLPVPGARAPEGQRTQTQQQAPAQRPTNPAPAPGRPVVVPAPEAAAWDALAQSHGTAPHPRAAADTQKDAIRKLFAALKWDAATQATYLEGTGLDALTADQASAHIKYLNGQVAALRQTAGARV